jgi:hypothetical protein
LTISAFGTIKEPSSGLLTRTDVLLLHHFAGASTTMILLERLSSLRMYKSLKPQPCSVQQQQRSYSNPVSSSEDRCLSLYLLSNSFFSYYLLFTSLRLAGPSLTHFHSTLLYCLVEMISKPSIALLILALTSSVNAAAIAPRQFLFGLIVREGHC